MVGIDFTFPVTEHSISIDACANGEYWVHSENGAATADAELVTRLVHAEVVHDGEECSKRSALQISMISMQGPALANGTGRLLCGKLQMRSMIVGFDAAGHIPEISIPANGKCWGKASVDVSVEVAKLVYAG